MAVRNPGRSPAKSRTTPPRAASLSRAEAIARRAMRALPGQAPEEGPEAPVAAPAAEEFYEVDVHRGTCTCPDFIYRGGNPDSRFYGIPCKHLIRALSQVVQANAPAANSDDPDQ